MSENNVILSVKDLKIQFRVRGRILTAIRGISLDIYEHESIAIVGESGSGKSVFTKSFAGMLDGNGFIPQGKIIFNDPELSDTTVKLTDSARRKIQSYAQELDKYAQRIPGAATWQAIQALEQESKQRCGLSAEEQAQVEEQLKELNRERANAYNFKQTLDPSKDKAQIKETAAAISAWDAQIKQLQKKAKEDAKAKAAAAKGDAAWRKEYHQRLEQLKSKYQQQIAAPATPEAKARNQVLAKEIYLSVGRYPYVKRMKLGRQLLKALEQAMIEGKDLDDEHRRDDIFDDVAFRVRYLDETGDSIHGTCVLNLANVKYAGDWGQIRGGKIATVFQDPMTSLNPILTIGKQITSIIMKHQSCSESEARSRAMTLMQKVGIPNAEKRFNDYPFQYSGGMRQRIVIAIALSCQPKILICDEPTTALDVTIQAQILELLKELQKEFGFTIVFITHDLGVVANIADRVAVLYAGQIVELATVEEIFYDPRHPYTWALLSSLPQLAQRNTELYSITGTPPSLYNEITGDAFAPRNPYCMTIDTLQEPPMFQVSPTHFAKTWLLDPRAPKMEKPEAIQNIHEKLVDAFHIEGGV